MALVTSQSPSRGARLRQVAAYLDSMIELVPEQYYLSEVAAESETWSKYHHVGPPFY